MPGMYPLPRPTTDRRFTLDMAMEVAEVLERNGFPAVRSGSDLHRLQKAVFSFLYVPDRPEPEPYRREQDFAPRDFPPRGVRPVRSNLDEQQPRRVVAESCPSCGETFYPTKPGTGERCRTCSYRRNPSTPDDWTGGPQ